MKRALSRVKRLEARAIEALRAQIIVRVRRNPTEAGSERCGSVERPLPGRLGSEDPRCIIYMSEADSRL
jgi:hypothetical protein